MQLTSPKVHLSQTIHDCHCSLRIVPYRAIIYASFSKRTPMTVYVSNKQVSSRQAYIYTLIYIGDQGIVYLFVGHVNRHWGAFAKRCINNRTMRREQWQSCIVWERCTFGEVSCMQVIPFLFVFILDGAIFWDDVKNSCPASLYYMTEGLRLLRWGLEWFQRSHIIVMPCLWVNS